MISRPCFVCGSPVEGEDLGAFGEAGLAHVRSEHPGQVPYPDMAVRRPMYEAAGFTEVKVRSRDTVMRRPT